MDFCQTLSETQSFLEELEKFFPSASKIFDNDYKPPVRANRTDLKILLEDLFRNISLITEHLEEGKKAGIEMITSWSHSITDQKCRNLDWKSSNEVYQRASDFRTNVEMWRKWIQVFCIGVEFVERERREDEEFKARLYKVLWKTRNEGG